MNSSLIESILEKYLPANIRNAESFDAWFTSFLFNLEIAAQKVSDRIEIELDELRQMIQEKESTKRQVWVSTMGPAHQLIKSTRSIRSKLGRELLEEEKNSTPLKETLSLSQVEAKVFDFPDLGRFRILCDLSSDAALLMNKLLGDEWEGKSGLMLLGEFEVNGVVKDFVLSLPRRNPAKGHRARQFTVKSRENGKAYLIEIQVMTLLQDAWDRRNHPIYEFAREKGELPDTLIISDVALAETLYIVDEQASRNWSDFLEVKKERKK